MESARFVCLGGQGMQWEAGKQGKVYGKTQVRIRLSVRGGGLWLASEAVGILPCMFEGGR
ncbi:hypothetical protein QR685DRAFT_568205 [Neurospora intermedia]|uniref:Uncharacterized protein n=1 Tax=Neurospora intermedia TaxID=5142 RepID=A0ABR3DRW6_NEUIN